MSRAFVKEDTEAVETLPDRPISAYRNLVTARGLALIEAEIVRFQRALAEAQAADDRTAVAAASRELRYWTTRRANAEVQPPPADGDSVRFGSVVNLLRRDARGAPEREQRFVIVGEDEADPTAGTLSYVSPLARALLGKEVGDVVRVGTSEVEIGEIT